MVNKESIRRDAHSLVGMGLGFTFSWGITLMFPGEILLAGGAMLIFTGMLINSTIQRWPEDDD